MQLTEHDWKYLNSVCDAKYEELAKRHNDKLRAELLRTDILESEISQNIGKLLREQRDTVKFCFGDWRRSTLDLVIGALNINELLTDEDVANLSDNGKATLQYFRDSIAEYEREAAERKAAGIEPEPRRRRRRR